MRKKAVTSAMILALVSLVFTYIFGADNNVPYGWTRVMGGGGGGISDFGFGIAVDPSGNVYTTGHFSGTPDFGADFGTSDIKTSAGEYDIFITKIKTDGTYGWTKTIGGIGADLGMDITTDASDNIYVTGYFDDTVDFRADFGGGSDIKTSAGSHDIFIMKIYADGTYGWTKIMGDTGIDDGEGIVIDSLGNIYVMGDFYDLGVPSYTVDFGADFGISDLKTSAGKWDIFVTKINADGTYAWTKIMGGTGADWGQRISVDSSNNIYLTGSFFELVDFGADFGASDPKASAGYGDIFVTKINADGTYAWTKIFGGMEPDGGRDVATDFSGNVYITGVFSDTVDFGADFGTSDIKTSAGYTDIFVTKISTAGIYGWTRVFGGTGTPLGYGDTGDGVDTDSSGNIYLTGYFSETVDFGADFGTSDVKISAGGSDIFITKINSDSTYGWTKAIGGTSEDAGLDIETDTSGNIHLTGGFSPPVDFGLDFGTTDLKSFGLIFVTKLAAEPLPVYVDIKPGACPNSLNLKAKGKYSVAILGTEDFDVTTVDPATILLTRESYEEIGVAPLSWSYKDVATPFEGAECDCHDLNGDGYLDLSLKFDTQEMVGTLELHMLNDEDSIPLFITGNLKEEEGSTPIDGLDCIKIKKK